MTSDRAIQNKCGFHGVLPFLIDYKIVLDLLLNMRQRSEMQSSGVTHTATDAPPLYKLLKADFVVTGKKKV